MWQHSCFTSVPTVALQFMPNKQITCPVSSQWLASIVFSLANEVQCIQERKRDKLEVLKLCLSKWINRPERQWSGRGWVRSWHRNRPVCVAALPPGQRVLAQHQTPPWQSTAAWGLNTRLSVPLLLASPSWLGEARRSFQNSPSSQSLKVSTGVHMYRGHTWIVSVLWLFSLWK